MQSLYALTKRVTAGFYFKSKQTAIIYYVYINPNKDWRQLVLSQLRDINSTGVLSVADLYIVVSNPSGVENIEAFFTKIKPRYKKIEYYSENKFEYWGVNFVWSLAQAHKKYKYFVYLHTKGMTHSEPGRIKVEEILTRSIFKDWQLCIKLFQEKDKINKIGLFPARKLKKLKNQEEIVRGGWIWYNFWWARASYIRKLEQPKIDPKHRFYYEEWLSYTTPDNADKLVDNFSIYSMTMNTYSNQEALDNTEILIRNDAVISDHNLDKGNLLPL
ncbi:hypothetical protein [uncultured Thiothrix sp.]|uniref:hypothetical protein n=1 Tax=uncultured Thiothrix sp. TaxID=223185 RepID=UPI00263094EB|nr:hypothetical protein [uncultured Thiothrix sp.]